MNTTVKISEILSEYFVDDTQASSRQPRSLLTESSVPITPHTCGWEIHKSPERFAKTFVFNDKDSLRNFIVECLEYEKQAMHSGQHRIDGLKVTVEVYTHDLDKVTELDQEYIKNIDFIYRDVLDFVTY